MITIIKQCHTCDVERELEVSDIELAEFTSGKSVQASFPYMSADDRELLISGICGKCFDKMFEGDKGE